MKRLFGKKTSGSKRSFFGWKTEKKKSGWSPDQEEQWTNTRREARLFGEMDLDNSSQHSGPSPLTILNDPGGHSPIVNPSPSPFRISEDKKEAFRRSDRYEHLSPLAVSNGLGGQGSMVVAKSSPGPFEPSVDKKKVFRRRDLYKGFPSLSLPPGVYTVSPFSPELEESPGDAMLEGARKLMKRNPEWIKSRIDEDGLPPPVNGKEENHFGMWLRGDIPSLPENGANMNCWEAVLTSAYLGGLVTKGQLTALYKKTQGKERKVGALLNQLGRESVNPVSVYDEPNPGDIIVTDSDSHLGHHVFIAGEDSMVFSHDQSDFGRGMKYNEYKGLLDNFAGHGGSKDYMVYRNRVHVVRFIHEVAQHQRWKMEIRYLPPSIFGTLPKDAGI